ncbi:MAG TPA: transposase [Candidatus Aminicenantes bacterium]|nr:transposase [Candidatus Aminicenantes bacterium]
MQEKTSKEKLYSLYHPEVECISKGKVHKKYEFGCKVAIVTTHKEGLCLSIEALHGNPYDGHTLPQAINTAEKLCKSNIKEIFVDKGIKE